MATKKTISRKLTAARKTKRLIRNKDQRVAREQERIARLEKQDAARRKAVRQMLAQDSLPEDERLSLQEIRERLRCARELAEEDGSLHEMGLGKSSMLLDACERINRDPIGVFYTPDMDDEIISTSKLLDDSLKTSLAVRDWLEDDEEEDFLWVTRDGRYLRPDEMDESHLRNCVSYTQRRLQKQMLEAVDLGTLEHLARAFYEFLRECRKRGLRI